MIMGICRRYPQYQNHHENDTCGEFAVVFSSSSAEDVFSSVGRQLLELKVLDEPPKKRRGRPLK
jgi:hypothetical protein